MIAPQLPKRRISVVLCLLLVASFVLGFPGVVQADPAADELFRSAYESRYTWEEQFPGYSAEVSVRYEKGLYHGIVHVNPDFSITTTGIKSDIVRQLVVEQLQMMATHRRRVPFAAIHGRNTFELEGIGNTRVAEIREVGDKMDSHYKVQDQKITQVNRVMGQLAVTVDTLGFLKPPEGYLAAHYQTTFRDAKTGEVLELQDISDSYDKVGKYFLLSRRTIRSSEPGQSVQERAPDTIIQFNDFQPLSTSAA